MGSRLSFNILSVLCVSAVYFGGLSGGGYFPVLSSFLSSFCAKASFHLSMSVLNFLEGSSSIGVKHCGQISLSPVYLSERTTTLLQLGQDNLIAIPVLQQRVDANTPLSRQCLQGVIYNRIWPELSLGLKANRQKEGRRGGQTPISRMKVQRIFFILHPLLFILDGAPVPLSGRLGQKNGAGEGIRTLGLNLGKVALYR